VVNFESTGETRAFEKACDFVEEAIGAGLEFTKVVQVLKRAWVYIHDERAYGARKDVERKLDKW